MENIKNTIIVNNLVDSSVMQQLLEFAGLILVKYGVNTKNETNMADKLDYYVFECIGDICCNYLTK